MKENENQPSRMERWRNVSSEFSLLLFRVGRRIIPPLFRLAIQVVDLIIDLSN